MNIYRNIYTLLDDIKALYSHAGGEKNCALAYVCKNLTAVLESLGSDHPTVSSDVTNFFLSCIYEMMEIAHNDIFDELHDCVMAMNLER